MISGKKDPDELINVNIRVTRRSAEWLAHFLNEYLEDLPQGAVPEGHEIIMHLWPVVMADETVEDNP